MTTPRRENLAVGTTHHVFNRSIAGYKIFAEPIACTRMIELIDYYNNIKVPMSFCFYKDLVAKTVRPVTFSDLQEKRRLVDIIAYCIMPTHTHLILHQLEQDGISIFMQNICNSYSRYFNILHHRKGPLWEGRFKNVLVETNEQLLHLSRYVHLNPTTDALVRHPQDWMFSSYKEYLGKTAAGICRYKDYIDMKPEEYRQFTEERVADQQELAQIKHLLLELF